MAPSTLHDQSRAIPSPLRTQRERESVPAVIDIDCHQIETLETLLPYLDEPFRMQIRSKPHEPGYFLPIEVADELVAGRIKRPDDVSVADGQALLGTSYSIVFPTNILGLGRHPQLSMEVALAKAYARWVTEEFLPQNEHVGAMLYLPFNSPDAALQMVEQYRGHKGVAGFFVSSMRHEKVHHERYLRLYRAIEESGLPLGFHPSPLWRERYLELFNRFASVCAVGYPLYNMIHLMNLVIHGILERFPKLKLVFYECGISWVPFVMYRLDNEYTKRPSDAPLLRAKPSEYIRRCYFSTQPLEWAEERDLEAVVRMVGPSRLLYASNYPRWDFDTPARIQQLAFLSPDEKRQILYGNAAKVFHLSLPRRGDDDDEGVPGGSATRTV